MHGLCGARTPRSTPPPEAVSQPGAPACGVFGPCYRQHPAVPSTLDRYLIRQIIPPFLLALGIYTFVLAIQPELDYAKLLLAKGVPLPTVGVLLGLLLPQALSLTIPMAFLTGLLMALGRLSGDRESVALLACGVSPRRVLRPILAVGLAVAALDMYVLMSATPRANQTWRAITFRLLTEQTAADIKPQVFFTKFPGKVLYFRDTRPDGRWSGVVLADTSEPGRPVVTLAETGSLVIDRDQRLVRLVLEQASQYAPGRTDPRVYTVSRLDPAAIAIPPDSVFGSGQTLPGMREMSIAELRAEIARKHAEGTPAHAEIMQMHQMFSFPVACLVFAGIGLALGFNTRKDGRLAGLTIGLAVIMGYYIVMAIAEGWAKGVARTGGPVDLVAAWARWIPNLVFAVLGVVALGRASRIPTGAQLSVRLPAWLTRRREQPRAGDRAAVRPAGRTVVVVRIPRLDLPMPRLLDRYVSRRYLGAIALTFVGLLGLIYIGSFVDLADKLFKEQADSWLFARFLLYSTPQFIIYVLPVATLIAVLGTIGALTRSGELVVMRACGVSLYRTAAPLLVFALAGSAILFGVEERVLGAANKVALDLRDSLRDHKPRPAAITAASNNWLVGDDGRIYAYAGFGTGTGVYAGEPTIQGLSVFAPAAGHPFRLRSHLYAGRARFVDGAWRGDFGWSQGFTDAAAPREDFTGRRLALPAVEDFRRAEVDPSTMTFGEYREYVRRLGASGFNVAEQRVTLHAKVALPVITIIMTLLAVPFGVTIGRKGALYGIGLAVILAGGYYLLMTLFVAVGSAGLLPPALAAWSANILFGTAAIYLGLTVRT